MIWNKYNFNIRCGFNGASILGGSMECQAMAIFTLDQ
jgi:hypothetical protein